MMKKKIIINYTTGNRFENGRLEVGRSEEFEVGSIKDLNEIFEEIPKLVDYFVSDENGNPIEAWTLYDLFDDKENLKI